MIDRPAGIGADDPNMGRDVAEAYDRKAVQDASPTGTWLGAAAGYVIVGIAVMAGVCAFLGLAWCAVQIAKAL